MHIHDLNGCAPVPLAHYLKALGILRLVAEQADPQARGWWIGDTFRLATKLDQDELEEFFIDKYKPTPMFNPWGGRSGFYSGSSESTARSVLTAIEKSSDPRFAYYKQIIKVARSTIKAVTGGSKPKNNDVVALILALKAVVRGKSAMWLDAVASILGTGKSGGVVFPAVFGTGGSEGSGSYTSAYMSAIDECLLKKKWNYAIRQSLFASNEAPKCRGELAMGQFMPAGVATPWDLLITFEGACLLRSAVVTRSEANGRRWLSSPFYVASVSAGYVSSGQIDEYALNKGKKMPGRGEQWFPLWQTPMLLCEITQIFMEGRAITKRGHATDGWSMARAISSRGTNHSVYDFIRYGYLQRNNLATHFAVPLGRFRVPDKISPLLGCLDDLDRYGWLSKLRNVSRDAKDKKAPVRLKQAERNLSSALFAVTQKPDDFVHWQVVLFALSDVEAVMATGSGFRAGPVPLLRPEWVQAADDGSVEFRLALAFALQAAAFGKKDERKWPIKPVRCHWLPLDDEKESSRFAVNGTGSQARLATKSEVVIYGRSGIEDAIALVDRRLVEASQSGQRRLPLSPAFKASASPADLAQLLSGNVDLDRTLALARAFMALDGSKWAAHPCPPKTSTKDFYPDDAWLAIRLSMLPWPLPDGRKIGIDPTIVRRLESGDAATAFELARRRLRAAGISTTVHCAAVARETARLWAAALAFPITPSTAAALVRRFDPNSK